ncbi:zf-HC2 domain-containing protein [Corynebacterium aquatimens]|uniref:Anti-sigma factor RsiW n=1 Tax=Corynebacterium aquatimens TaxID=1190508 RepID=A0A931DZX7_9CORY|nr:zf-HC2 domain-containing protein [Corynebacterium aquatimens]MBG6121297.1 anti-sigma factor RsiW [Corynebacterium aquatimens]WJY66153.1 Anti-sigma-E factor RseA [Corynebacterium aquatimens]
MSSSHRRHFDSTEHVSAEAIAALIDDELSPTAAHRARVHIVLCESCRNDANAQRYAAEAVRNHNVEEGLRAPRGLVDKLAQICETEQPAARKRSLKDLPGLSGLFK